MPVSRALEPAQDTSTTWSFHQAPYTKTRTHHAHRELFVLWWSPTGCRLVRPSTGLSKEQVGWLLLPFLQEELSPGTTPSSLNSNSPIVFFTSHSDQSLHPGSSLQMASWVSSHVSISWISWLALSGASFYLGSWIQNQLPTINLHKLFWMFTLWDGHSKGIPFYKVG